MERTQGETLNEIWNGLLVKPRGSVKRSFSKMSFCPVQVKVRRFNLTLAIFRPSFQNFARNDIKKLRKLRIRNKPLKFYRPRVFASSVCQQTRIELEGWAVQLFRRYVPSFALPWHNTCQPWFPGCKLAIPQNIPVIHCGRAAGCEPAIPRNVPAAVARNGSFEQAEKTKESRD